MSAETSAEIVDTNTGLWNLTARMPTGFVPGPNPWTAKLEDGYFLVAGGFNSFNTGNLASSYIYSVASNSWIRTGDLPVGATMGSNFSQTDSVVLDDGRVLVAGGLTIGLGASTASMVFTPNYANLGSGASGAAVGSWDFTRDKAGHVTTLSGATEHHKLIKLLDGRVLVIVGFDRIYASAKYGTVYRDTPGVQAELFDPKSGTWTPLPNMPAIRGEDDQHDGVKGVRQQAAVALSGDGRVLITGGFSEPTDAQGRPLLKQGLYVRASVIVFDPYLFDAGVYPWLITAPMRVARHSHAMSNLPGSAGIISVWGWTTNGWTATAEIYDSRQGIWKSAASMPALQGTNSAVSQPWGCSATMPSGDMLIAGGIRDAEVGGTSRHTYTYQP